MPETVTDCRLYIKYLWIFNINNIIFWMYSFQFLVLFQMKHLFFLPVVLNLLNFIIIVILFGMSNLLYLGEGGIFIFTVFCFQQA